MVRSDVVSRLTIVSLAIPLGISYAKLANLPPIIGLLMQLLVAVNFPAILLARLGFVIDFLSKATFVGFMAGSYHSITATT
ncbi:hypothetical protein AgCh_014365 [Apium graveolens]